MLHVHSERTKGTRGNYVVPYVRTISTFFFFSYVRAEIENRWGMTNAKSSLLHSPPPLRGPRAKRQRQDLGYLASSVSVPYFVVQKENRQVIDETGVAQRGILDVHAHV